PPPDGPYVVKCYFNFPGAHTDFLIGTGVIYDPAQSAWWALITPPVNATGQLRAKLFAGADPTPKAISSPLLITVSDLGADPLVSIDEIDLTAVPDVTLSGSCSAGYGVSCWFVPTGTAGPIVKVAAAVNGTGWTITFAPVAAGVYDFSAEL